MMSLRVIAPADLSDRVVDALQPDPRVTNLVLLPGAARRPAGDLVLFDVARESTAEILDWLDDLGIYAHGGVTVSEIDAAPSVNARATDWAAPGAPDDAIVWDVVEHRAQADVRSSWTFHAFLTLATLIAAVAVVIDSSILVVGAMVVGPEFAAVSALALGLVLRRSDLSGRAAVLLLKGFGLAVLVTVLMALLARAVGWIALENVTAVHTQTGFIYRPDKWSLVVAVLAGCAGVLSQTAGKGNALVGVFISVTTVPAAGEFALALAVWAPAQMGGAAAQLGINLLGMTVAGVLTLVVVRALWRRVPRLREVRPVV